MDAIYKAFYPNRLDERSIAPLYSPEFNPFVASKGYTDSKPATLLLEASELRKGKVKVLKHIYGDKMIIEESYDTFVKNSNYVSDGSDYDEQLIGTVLVRDSGIVSIVLLLLLLLLLNKQYEYYKIYLFNFLLFHSSFKLLYKL